MKFSAAVNTVISTNISKVCGFEVNGKSFSILTSGIYKNKIKAIIREYSTNAIDSHKESGSNENFEVHLPTIREPYFYVRDYGTGLDNSQIEDVYCTLFKSTKDGDNEYNGCLGIGAFSGYSYNTKTFTIESIKDGMKYIYSCYIGKSGCPEYSNLYTGETDEPTGIKVQIPVTVNDIGEFKENAEDVYKWFTNKPKFIGEQLEIVDQYVELTNNYGVLTNRGCFAVMSNVAYPIELHYSLNEYSQFLRGSSVALFFNNGDISFTPSRESLEYTERTIQAIKNKLKQVFKEVQKSIEKKISDSKTEWEAIANYNYYYITYNQKFHGVIESKTNNFDFNGKELSSCPLDVISGVLTVPGRRKHSFTSKLSINKSYKYVINDLTTGSISRSKLLASKNINDNVYLISQEFYDSIPYTKDISSFILASTLPKAIRNTTTYVRSKFTDLNLMKNQERLVDAWVGVDINSATSKYYVIKKGYRPVYYGDSRDDRITPCAIYSTAKNAGITDPIYATTEKNEAKLIKLGWVKIQDAINEKYVSIAKEVESEKGFINKYLGLDNFVRYNSNLISNINKVFVYNPDLPQDLLEILEVEKDVKNNKKKLEDLQSKHGNLQRSMVNYTNNITAIKFTEKDQTAKKYRLLVDFRCGSGYNMIDVKSLYEYVIGVDFCSKKGN